MKTLEQRAQTVAACRHRNSGSVAITALITLTVLAFVAEWSCKTERGATTAS